MTPIYAGGSRALCRLKSGEYICVDADSLESIDYLLGFDMEADVMPVFQRFLTPSSIVLDIGANVGLYTVTTATVVKHRGQIFAFEGNPHTFDLLRRSVYANRLLDNPNVTLVNALVSDRKGRGRLNYRPDFLGSATMGDVSQRSRLEGHWMSLESDMITIDSFLPAGLAVDLVKIDVEGHEPFVLKGMERTLANSPNVRLIVEFFHEMVGPVFGVDRFFRYIWDLGFDICEIEAGGHLALLEREQEAPGDCYLLLTRTPREDMARDYFVMPMTGFFYPEGLGAVDGELVYDPARHPGPSDALLLYGPYLSLKPGRYIFSFIGDVEGGLSLRFASQYGKVTLKSETIYNFDTPITVDLPELAEHFEIVMSRTDSLKSLRLSEVRVVAPI